jgi:hypothetical protein
MKKIILPGIFFLVLAGIASCEKVKSKINEATEFNMDYSTSLTIPASPGVAVKEEVELSTPDIPTHSSLRFAAEGTKKDLIEEIKLTRLRISNTGGGKLSYIKSLSIYLRTAGVSDILVATRENIPDTVSVVDADLKDVNIKEYLFRDNIQFRIKTTIETDTTITGDQKLSIDQTMRVKGKRI